MSLKCSKFPGCQKTVELDYNVMTGTIHFVPVKTSVVLTEKYNVTVNWN